MVTGWSSSIEGSTSYGQAFESNVNGHYGEDDYDDVMTGAGRGISQVPQLDADRQYIAGGIVWGLYDDVGGRPHEAVCGGCLTAVGDELDRLFVSVILAFTSIQKSWQSTCSRTVALNPTGSSHRWLTRRT